MLHIGAEHLNTSVYHPVVIRTQTPSLPFTKVTLVTVGTRQGVSAACDTPCDRPHLGFYQKSA